MKKQSYTQIFIGIAVVGLGLGFLLDALNIADFSNIIGNWWPLLVIAAGVLSLMSNPGLRLWPLAIIAGGVLLQLRALEVVTFNVWQLLWPLGLIAFGLSLLFDRGMSPRPVGSDENNVNIFVAFSGIESKSSAKAFAGGKMTALFGGAKLDLRKATLQKGATLEVFTAFGGGELIVPENWKVVTSGLPLFGGWEDKTSKPTDASAPVLHIRGTCLFGGIEIKN